MDNVNPHPATHLSATCSAACPVHTDTREYVQRISRGDYEGALDILLEVNPFPSVCGRICHHPCESECRRQAIDSAVSLRMLKRFVVENTTEYRKKRAPAPAPDRGKTVAVVGSGPSGLTAARDLALMGYAVTVFEQADRLGGMLAHAIPHYRLPLEALQEDIDDILAAGVQARTGVSVGRDIPFEDLRRDFDAILIAVGLAESHSLPIPNIDSQGVILGIPFLWDIANENPPALGGSVVVIGGGNVAIDVARCARRVNQGRVTMACLESREEMPAWDWEVREAEEEGIEIMNSWGPKAVEAADGKVTGITFKRCTRVFDENRRFSPAYDENETVTVVADNIIITIGQRSNTDFALNTDVAMDRGRLIADRATMATSVKGVFACGEVITGPGSAIAAVGTGHDAARVIAHFLETNQLMKLPPMVVETIGELPAQTASRARRAARVEVGLMDAQQRVRDFSPIEPGYTEAQALAESRRCLACATGAHVTDEAQCAGCLTCVRICPFGVAAVDRFAAMPPQACQTCGLCAAVCPAAGVTLDRFPTNHMKQAIAARLETVNLATITRPFVVAYCCINATTSRRYLLVQTGDEIHNTGILRVLAPCVGRLGQIDLQSPLELGADRVIVLACSGDTCAYPEAEELLRRRVDRTRKFLDQAGAGADALRLYTTRGTAEESWPEFFEDARKQTEPAAAK